MQLNQVHGLRQQACAAPTPLHLRVAAPAALQLRRASALQHQQQPQRSSKRLRAASFRCQAAAAVAEAPREEPFAPQVCVVLGMQWGDEGKGKLVDILAQQYEIVARAQVREEQQQGCL